MSDIAIYHATPRQVRSHVVACIEADLVPFIQSSPGMGKSSIVRSIAKEYGLKLIDHRLSTSAPEDLSGLPEFYTDAHGIRRARFAPFDIFPTVGTPVPEGYEGWLLFLDEANSAPKTVQAAAYKLVLDKQVGQYDLHPNVAIVMAGNLSTDRAITNPLSTAMQSRVNHLEMQVSREEWMEDVAFKEDYDPRIIAYLNYQDRLMDFRPDHQDKTFCCPRTWEFMNRLTKGKDVTDDKIALYAGTITSGVAVDFVQFCKVYEGLPNIEAILADPKGIAVPTDAATRWAVISHLMDKTTDTNLADLAIYVNRFSMEFRVLFFRSLMVRQPALWSHPAFAKAMGELSRYLHN